jgi:hypothetical protein
MQLHRIIRIAALSLGVAGVAAPVAGAQPIDTGPPPAVHQDLSGFYRPMAPHGNAEHKAPNIELRRNGTLAQKDIALRHAGAGTCGTDYSRNSVDGGYCAAAPTVDLRSPDARDAARGVSAHRAAPVAVDLRSPDARDAARGVSAHRVAPVSATTAKSNDTDWGKVGIIGGSVLGGLALFALGFVLFTRRLPALSR